MLAGFVEVLQFQPFQVGIVNQHVLGNDQLTDQVDQAVELSQFDTDILTFGRRLGAGRRFCLGLGFVESFLLFFQGIIHLVG